MRSDYYHDIDLHANQLYNSRLHNITTLDRVALGLTLTMLSKGYAVYDIDLNKPYFWDGTQWAVAGGGQNLQQVTDIGNITTNSISVASLNLFDSTNLEYASISTNGNRILLTDSNSDYILKVERGNLTFYTTNGTPLIINQPANYPIEATEYSLPQIGGTFAFSVNGTSANNFGEIFTTLQAITDEGNTTTNNINVNALGIRDNTILGYSTISSSSGGFDFNDLSGSKILRIEDSLLELHQGASIAASFRIPEDFVLSQIYYFPKASGTLPLSVNGNTADASGNITITTGTVTGVTATSPITSSGGTAPVISTSMATNRLIGRSTAGTGVMEEITVGSGLSLSGGTLNATAQSVGFEQNFLLMGA